MMTDIPATDRSPLDLDAIRVKWLQQCGSCDAGLPMSCSHPQEDYRPVILDLVREVTALRAELDSARAESAGDFVADEGWTEEARFEVARAERTDPHDERDERCFACRNGKHSLCEPGTACACRCLGEERTEPATDEDVKVVALALFPWLWVEGSTDDPASGDSGECYDAARAVLAALDLPGRVRALREENERLRTEYKDLAAFAETAHGDEAWTDLMGRYTAARQERDDLKRRIAEGEVRLEGVIDRLTAERDAANVALAELVRLKDGPRDEEYVRTKPRAWDVARQVVARADKEDQ